MYNQVDLIIRNIGVVRTPNSIIFPLSILCLAASGKKVKNGRVGKTGNKLQRESSDKSFSRSIAMQCTLTTELLNSKKQLSEKNDALLKMQEKCFTMEKLLSEKDQQLMKLQNDFDNLKAERFCDDLIQFDEPTNSEIQTNTVDENSVEEIASATPSIATEDNSDGFQWTPIN